MHLAQLKTTGSAAYRFLLVTLLYSAVTAVFFHRNLPGLTFSLIGPPEDNMQDLWNTWYAQQFQWDNVANGFFTERLFYPEGTSLVYHSFAYPVLAFIRLVRFLLMLPLSIPVLVALQNLAILASFVLAGVFMYLLAYHLTRSFPAALVGGYIFAFSPFHFAHSLHHVHVATIQFIPLFVFFTLRFEENSKASHASSAILFCVLSALSSWYYLVYNLFFLLFHYIFRAVQSRTLFLWTLLLQHAMVVAGSLLLLSPLIWAMVSHRTSTAYARGHDDFVADAAGLLLPHAYHLTGQYLTHIHERFTGNPWEASVYLGIFNLGIIVWSFFNPRYRRDAFFRWTLCGMICFTLLAAGRYLHVLGESLTSLMLPTGYFEYLPVLANLRTPSRAIVYTYLFLGLLIAWLIASSLRNTNKTMGQLRPFLVGLLCTGIVIDYLSFSRQSTPVICPPAYAYLSNSAAGFLNVPFTYESGNRFMMYQLCLDRPIVYATVSRKLNTTLSDRIRNLSPAEKREALRDAGVNEIVVHLPLMKDDPFFDLTEYTQNYRLIFADQTEMVFAVE